MSGSSEMEENGVHEPLLQSNESIETDRGEKANGSVRSRNFDADEATLPVVSENSSKWKYKYHCVLSGDEFCESHNHSEGQREYNRKQREMLARFHEIDSMTARNTGSGDQEEPRESFAINFSYCTNLFLFIIKVIAAARSGSLAIVASALDSLLDLLAGAILWFTKWSMQHINKYKYPIGKSRVQPVGIVVFAAIMASLGLQVLLTGVQELIEGDSTYSLDNRERVWLITVMSTVILSKLGLFLYCRTFRSEIVQTYATDHKLDMLTNSVGLAAALLADWSKWWIDPAGAILLALYTISNWSKTLIENAGSLVGQSAPPEFLQLVTYVAYNHHPKIRRLDTIRAYMLGGLYFVEVDIELPEDMLLREAHNIGETLQNKLEAMPEVERAYVHLDFECSHKPEHDGGSFIV
ncbi:hypothetical protein KC19_1G277800 [Ceratodon purpureus]|uniref:Cation efflux protein cytoplasmic domain-containing protein n=1 Tax=Ceratodon purpureus TaxID=3225 RepID=A0A8T0JBR2_CERPU|nr:hypothetical protein KC19_1G277800 [Ceratodon purpureus]